MGYIIDGGTALENRVGKSKVDLISTIVRSPLEMSTTYGPGLASSSAMAAAVGAQYAAGMQMELILDLAGWPLYLLSSQFQTDLAALVAAFAGSGTFHNDLYLVLFDGVEAYNTGGGSTGGKAYMTGPTAASVGGSSGAWTLTISYPTSGGVAPPGTPVVGDGDTVYLDETIGIYPLDSNGNETTWTSGFPVQTGSVSTTGGVTTFTLTLGATHPVVLAVGAYAPTPSTPADTVVLGGRLKTDATTAVNRYLAANSLPQTQAQYRSLLVSAFLASRTTARNSYGSVSGVAAKCHVGLGLTDSSWSTGTADLSPWASALTAADINCASLSGPYSGVSSMITRLDSMTSQLASAYPKDFVLSWFDIYDPAVPLLHDTTHYTNITNAFQTFLGTVFSLADPSTMTTLTGRGLKVWNWLNDDYLNTMEVGTSFATLADATRYYGQAQPHYSLMPATAAISIRGAATIGATARLQAQPTSGIGATSRISKSVTSGIGATASISVQRPASITATAALSVQRTGTIGATASISRTLPATITATASVAAPVTSGISARATVQGSASSTIGATAQIAVVGHYTAGINATANIAKLGTGTIGATARISIAGSAPQPATARIIATPTSGIGATAQVIKVSTATIGGTAQIVATPIRTIGATAAVQAPAHATISATAQITAGTPETKTIPARATIQARTSSSISATAEILGKSIPPGNQFTTKPTPRSFMAADPPPRTFVAYEAE